MTKKKIIGLVSDYLLPFMKENNYEIFDIDFVKEGQTWYLKVFIDKDTGVTIGDCEIVTKYLNIYLDKEDPISYSYILEVSSPGADRPLKSESDFEKYKGELIDIKLYKSVNKEKEFQGILNGFENGVVTITDEENNVLTFALTDMAVCKLAVIF